MDKKTPVVVGLAAVAGTTTTGIIAALLEQGGKPGLIVAASLIATLTLVGIAFGVVCQANYRHNRQDPQHTNCNVANKIGVMVPPVTDPPLAPAEPAKARQPTWLGRLRQRRRTRRGSRSSLQRSSGLPPLDQAAAVPVPGPVEGGGGWNDHVTKAKDQDLVRGFDGSRTNDPGHC